MNYIQASSSEGEKPFVKQDIDLHLLGSEGPILSNLSALM